MTDFSSTSPIDNHRDNIICGSYHYANPHSQLFSTHETFSQPSLHSNGKMRLGKSKSNPVTSGELPPLVGIPHDLARNHQTTSDTSAIPAVCRGALDSDPPTASSVSSPLMRRRLKYMVRQCSDSELVKNNSSLGRLRLGAASSTAGPVPHPPDQSPRSQNSSETNSPRTLSKPPALNSSWSGPSRISRSLEASPMVVRRVREGVRRNSGEQDSSSSSRPSSPPCSDQDQKRRPRPFSFGSYSDVLQYVSSSNNEPSQILTASTRAPGSPFVTRRTVGLRGIGPLALSRPDTPANDALSLQESKKSHQISTSSGERSEVQDNDEANLALEDCVDYDDSVLPRRRLRRDSGSQHAQRNSIKKSQQVAVPMGTSDYPNAPHYPHEDHVVDHLIDDDTGHPSNLYDIQERRESILSIEAVQEIARRFANNGPDSSDEATNKKNDDNDCEEHKNKTPKRETTPEYRKEPLTAETRVSNWLKGLQDPTEMTPTNLERILPDII
ncbi:uncharacterized protein LOC110979888 [Acanthaster planci]|uniref:Uncharacterized protein LOC110979888 n=1 Tax=Acanthaster planci TaxID=133434 RepID=A0A8B7YGL2_ACAPL|nr:uncharacterized protein LOC110979888 [Acanthaster planci]